MEADFSFIISRGSSVRGVSSTPRILDERENYAVLIQGMDFLEWGRGVEWGIEGFVGVFALFRIAANAINFLEVTVLFSFVLFLLLFSRL